MFALHFAASAIVHVLLHFALYVVNALFADPKVSTVIEIAEIILWIMFGFECLWFIYKSCEWILSKDSLEN